MYDNGNRQDAYSLVKNKFDQTWQEARLRGFSDSELRPFYMDDLCNQIENFKQVEYPELLRLLALAYYKGKLKGLYEMEQEVCLKSGTSSYKEN